MRKHIVRVVRGTQGLVYDRIKTYALISKDILRKEIAKSNEGRSICVYRIGNGKIPILLTSGLHGNEVGTVKLAHGIIDWLHSDTLKIDATYYVVPCLNPDGFKLARRKPSYFRGGGKGRLNARGVDLNRNFDTPNFTSDAKWNYGKNYSHSRPVFAGKKPFSEPETKAISDFALSHKIKVWFMFHNAGRDVLPSRDKLAKKLAKKFSDISGFTLFSEQKWDELRQTGTPKEWCEAHKISFVEIEGSGRWSSDWPDLKPALRGTLESIA